MVVILAQQAPTRYSTNFPSTIIIILIRGSDEETANTKNKKKIDGVWCGDQN